VGDFLFRPKDATERIAHGEQASREKSSEKGKIGDRKPRAREPKSDIAEGEAIAHYAENGKDGEGEKTRPYEQPTIRMLAREAGSEAYNRRKEDIFTVLRITYQAARGGKTRPLGVIRRPVDEEAGKEPSDGQ
jgi:hypothetical protein